MMSRHVNQDPTEDTGQSQATPCPDMTGQAQPAQAKPGEDRARDGSTKPRRFGLCGTRCMSRWRGVLAVVPEALERRKDKSMV